MSSGLNIPNPNATGPSTSAAGTPSISTPTASQARKSRLRLAVLPLNHLKVFKPRLRLAVPPPPPKLPLEFKQSHFRLLINSSPVTHCTLYCKSMTTPGLPPSSWIGMTDADRAIPKHTPASSRKTLLKLKSTPGGTKSTSNHPNVPQA